MAVNILMEIERRMNSFSKGQKSIAAYILAHYDKAVYMTASKLGAAADVSESTVVRFAFELGALLAQEGLLFALELLRRPLHIPGKRVQLRHDKNP